MSSMKFCCILCVLNNPKHLDPSYRTNLDLWDCFGRIKTLFYNPRNRVVFSSEILLYSYFRALMFNHMAESHSFNVGQPDNLGKESYIIRALDKREYLMTIEG